MILNNLSKGGINRLVFINFYFSLGLLSFVPNITDLSSLYFIFSLSLIFFITIYNLIKKPIVDSYSLLALVFVFNLAFFNSIVALNNGTSVGEYLRALVPFIFILFYIPIFTLMKKDAENILLMLLLSALVWSVKIYVMYISDLMLVFSGGLGRLTYVSTELLIPFGLIGFILSIYILNSFKLKLVFCSIFFVLIIASGYRAHLLLCIAVFLFYIRFWNSIFGLGLFLLSLLFGFFLLVSDANIIELFVDRITKGSSGDTVRENEISYALNQFILSPIWGQGLGNPVPIEVTRTDNMLDFFEKSSVSYIHNFFYYFLMNTGITGTSIMLLTFLGPVVSVLIRKGGDCLDRHVNECACVAIICLVAFFFVSASFRQIQMMICMATLISVITNNKRSDNV
ncbi:TPA: O-antigen ligase family protein [Vibrio vulnificus]|nr:O-antigen ligase family protein [Vibrio vulnificus]HDY8102391.1 O-antigen ligase family protein [Vibrio vulnificus]